MKKFEKKYKELSKKYTDQEIVESMLIPADLSESEKQKAQEEIKKYRLQRLREMTEQQRLLSDLIRLRIEIEDYIISEDYTPEKSFGQYLGEYARILKKNMKALSEDLNIHYTRMSRIFNDKEDPNVDLVYRLDKHSGRLLSALLWWKLMIKKQEFEIKQDKKALKRQASKVKNALEFKA